MSDSLKQDKNKSVGSGPAIIERFCIKGLHAYRDIEITSKYAATIVIARNGAGKTTLLGALDAFLKCQFYRLLEIDFREISCKLRGVDESLVLTKEDLLQLSTLPEDQELLSTAAHYEIDPSALLEFIESDYHSLRTDGRGLYNNPTFYSLYAKQGYSIQSTKIHIDRIAQRLSGRCPNIDRIRQAIRTVLQGTEIVYLPTYRRIELSLPEAENRKARKQTSVQEKLGISRHSLYPGEINFGLADISERLVALNQEMLIESNQGYREVSARIIDDLINGNFDQDNINAEKKPSEEDLKLFLSRIQEGQRIGRFEDTQIPNLERIYTGENISPSSERFLNYFLGKLNTVMSKTRNIERTVEDFVKSCNNYLSSQDQSTELAQKRSRNTQSEDDKILSLNRKDLKVSVTSEKSNRRIPLSSLSSGEKQMISLFARLHLYSGNKIILIDEPELSLSIDWQRKIMVDILSSSTCTQAIAITHSPFIFDNDLEPFATSLKLKIHANNLRDEEVEEEEE